MFQRTAETWSQVSPPKQKLFIASIILILLMLAAVVWSIVRNLNAEPIQYAAEPGIEEDAPDSIEALVPDSSVLPPAQSVNRAVLERHFDAIGGVKRLATINSLLAHGDVTFADGREMPFVVAKKKGQRIRVSTKDQINTFVMVVTPEDAWRGTLVRGQLVDLGDLSAEEGDDMRRFSYVVSELFMAMNNSWTTEYLGQQAFNYKMAHCYEVKLNPRHFIRFYIDPDDFLDIGREDRFFDEDGTLRVTRLLNSEHAELEGLTVPTKIETYIDGELAQTFIARDLEINPGILDNAFIRPDPPAKPPEE